MSSPVRSTPFPRRTPFGEREVELVTRAVRSQSLFWHDGTMVKDLQTGFAGLYGATHAAASSSGTAAIHVALGALDLEPGDEVITAPITDAGTIVPIVYQNAIPVFADIGPGYTMDPADVEARVTPRTKAILAVHLFGNPCDMSALSDIARRHDLYLVEDCSQAHLTEYQGRLLGTLGDIAAFSLQQSKHMTTGEGGVTITSRDDLAERMSLFVDKGWTRAPGWGARVYAFLAPNYRMTELQGAVGVAQLEKVRDVVERRHSLGTRLRGRLEGLDGVILPEIPPGGRPSYWLFAFEVTVPARDFAHALGEEGIPAGDGYIGEPIFICMDALAGKRTFGNSGHPFNGAFGHEQVEYRKGMCPRTELALSRMITIGINENYSDGDIDDVARGVEVVADRSWPAD